MVRNKKSVAVGRWYRSSVQPCSQLCTKSYLKSSLLSFSRGHWLIHCELTWIIFNISSLSANGVFPVTPDACNVADSGCGVLQREVTWHVDTRKCCCLRHSEVWSWPFCYEHVHTLSYTSQTLSRRWSWVSEIKKHVEWCHQEMAGPAVWLVGCVVFVLSCQDVCSPLLSYF